MLEELTTKQKRIFVFIEKFIAEHEYPPTIREICKGVGLSSPATAFVHLDNLKNKGYITMTNNKFRTIKLLVENEYLKK